MLPECEDCIRITDRCKTIIEEDPKFRLLNCPCFECIVKVTCQDICKKQASYMWKRICISYDRIKEMEEDNMKIEDLIRETL